MRTTTQGLVLAFLGAVLVRLAWEGAYLRFVTEWMRWPLLVSGVLLVLLAVRPLLSAGQAGQDHADGVPAVTWLLLLPALVVFVVSPPALGAYLAERRADEAPPASPVASFAPLPEGGTPVLEVEELLWRALDDDGATLAGRSVEVRGFVSHGPDGVWYVTRMVIGCCAADAAVVRVQVEGADRPERDRWVAVTGTWRDGTGVRAGEQAVLDAESVRRIRTPAVTYG
ncbi:MULTISPECIES: TIGR03943 family putative permease subunit [unclassified Nocardioides]|uniref:TIGR03943 family putative permease subunit n=1 Tax=unclassified Nocardioides TaxID=2615069 RepID=UPI003014840E